MIISRCIGIGNLVLPIIDNGIAPQKSIAVVLLLGIIQFGPKKWANQHTNSVNKSMNREYITVPTAVTVNSLLGGFIFCLRCHTVDR